MPCVGRVSAADHAHSVAARGEARDLLLQSMVPGEGHVLDDEQDVARPVSDIVTPAAVNAAARIGADVEHGQRATADGNARSSVLNPVSRRRPA